MLCNILFNILILLSFMLNCWTQAVTWFYEKFILSLLILSSGGFSLPCVRQHDVELGILCDLVGYTAAVSVTRFSVCQI